MADSHSEVPRLEANELPPPSPPRRGDGDGDEKAVHALSWRGMSSYAFGLVLLLFVVFLWTASSFLGSSIFADGTYAKPFFLTYLNTSTFVLAATPNFVAAAWRNRDSKQWRAQLAWVRERYRRGGLRLVFADPKDDDDDDDGDDDVRKDDEQVPSEGQGLLSRSYERDDEEDIRISNSTAFSTAAASSSSSSSSSAPPPPPPPPPPQQQQQYTARLPTSQRRHLALLPTAKIAFQFCPLWFLSNYLASACLQHTSVASTTILTSTSSIWTLALGVVSGTERFTLAKSVSVAVSLLGIVLISRADLTAGGGGGGGTDTGGAGGDEASGVSRRMGMAPFPDKPPQEIILGDAMALASAIVYGYYTVFLKRTSMAAQPLQINMSLFFGLIGLINTVVLAPLLPLLSLLGIEAFELPPTSHVWAIVLVNSTASLVADISWAHALLLTSPLVVTVGLSLTIPVSMVGEIFLQGRFESLVYWFGSVLVVGSFVFVAREQALGEDADVGAGGGGGGGADAEALLRRQPTTSSSSNNNSN